jgi:hypothetical protein
MFAPFESCLIVGAAKQTFFFHFWLFADVVVVCYLFDGVGAG